MEAEGGGRVVGEREEGTEDGMAPIIKVRSVSGGEEVDGLAWVVESANAGEQQRGESAVWVGVEFSAQPLQESVSSAIDFDALIFYR